MTPLAQLLSLSEETLTLGLLVFLRVGAAVLVLPGFSERALPMRIKLVVAIALAFAVAAAYSGPPPAELTPQTAAGAILAETAIGLFLGLGLRMFVFALQIAGSIAAQSTSLAQIGGGAFADPMPAIGQILTLGGIALLMLTGFHVKTVVYFVQSYGLFPLDSFPSTAALAEVGIAQVASAFSLGFQLAAPFFLLSVLYNIILGVINRAMPQLMVAFVGAPLITWGSIALLFLVAPFMLSTWAAAVDTFLAAPYAGSP